MPRHWHDVEHFTVEMATRDLERRGEVTPLLVAFTGEEQRFLAFLRWFPKGAYADPMIELLALAIALDADRLAVALTGRLTSLDDPVPPVTDAGDLRQRALGVEYVDGAGGPLRQHTILHPFDVTEGRVTWGEAMRLSGGQGWIPSALRAAVAARGRLAAAATDGDIRVQATRCVALGHELYLAAPLRDQLGFADQPSS